MILNNKKNFIAQRINNNKFTQPLQLNISFILFPVPDLISWVFFKYVSLICWMYLRYLFRNRKNEIILSGYKYVFYYQESSYLAAQIFRVIEICKL